MYSLFRVCRSEGRCGVWVAGGAGGMVGGDMVGLRGGRGKGREGFMGGN